MQTILLPLMALLSCGIIAAPAAAQDNAELAKKAKALLQQHCSRCHGKGRAESGFSYVLDRGRLVERKKIVPGKPADSKLFKKIAAGEMPPEEDDSKMPPEKLPPFPADAKTILEKWILAGAPDFNAAPPKRDFISNRDVLKFVLDDLENKVAERDRKFARYFTITHLHNAGLAADELLSYRLGLSKLLNSLSWNRTITKPAPIDPAQTVFRIDLRDFDWDESVWEAILAANPYGVTDKEAATAKCSAYTRTTLPYVRADWFVFAASRPPLYHDVLRLPKTDSELEKKLEIDVAKDIKNERVWRAGFNVSGVSQNNRLIERHQSTYGAYWKSYDFAANVGRKDLFKHPLGPGSAEQLFQHDGGEIIFNLPNGLQAYLLVNAKGERIDEGPTKIVSDKDQPDKAVRNGVSCMRCHAQGIIAKEDQVREGVVANRNAYAKFVAAFGLIVRVMKLGAFVPPSNHHRHGGEEITLDLGGGVKMEFVRIPAGKFQMGSPENEKDRSKDEDQHEVEITRLFYLGKYEVTQEQYEKIVGKNPSFFSADGDGKAKVKDMDTRRFPVENVSWDDAVAFCGKLSVRDGKRRYRLPSEAEWEYACRAGTASPFHFGKTLNGDKVNCDGNYPYGTDKKGDCLERPCRVGSYEANAFGLHDMHGNVWEWCQDYYGPYKSLELKDPLRTEKVDESARVLRGGSWDYAARVCRAAYRFRNAPGYRCRHDGFRVAFRLD